MPASHLENAHRIYFLCRSLIGFERSHESLFHIATHNLSFQQVYGEQKVALKLHKEAILAELKDRVSNSLRRTDKEIVPVIILVNVVIRILRKDKIVLQQDLTPSQ